MEIAGYIAAAFIGLSLGLLGGGGSILTVPVLVYLFGLNPLLATSYSLFIVGSTSMVGAITNYREGLINLKTAFYFGTASIATVFLTRKFIIPVIPENLGTLSGYSITSSFLTMFLFAVLMIVAAASMIIGNSTISYNQECSTCIRFFRLMGYGVAIGFITGILGAGGGFLLIPALVLLVKLPMKKAIGTSLLIITLNSLIGFAGDLGHFTINWSFLLIITAIAMTGIIAGSWLSGKLSADKLKKGFGWFILIMGVLIIWKEVAGKNF